MARRRKSYDKTKKLLLGSAIVAALILLLYVFFLWQKLHSEEIVDYSEFGIDLPRQYQIHGIDVSRYQDLIAWDAVRDMQVQDVKIGFAIIKATEGIELKDPFFKRNWKKAKEAGVVRGAYHFFYPGKNVKAQIRNFRNTVKLEAGDLPPVLDIETSNGLSKRKVRQHVREWLEAMEEIYGVKPIIYTYVSFYEKYLSGSFDDYPLWVAHYFQPEKPRIARNWDFWQHNDGGRVSGIVNKVDFNVFNGDSAAFRALLVP